MQKDPRTGLSAMDALGLYYQGETLGVREKDLVKIERQLVLPPLLGDFLRRCGDFTVNSGVGHLCCPDRLASVRTDTGVKWMLLFGSMGDGALGILEEDCGRENPPVWYGACPEEESNSGGWLFRCGCITL